ncbi:putative bifunctional diguanylate cyclase/phosphodiesterase [Parasphingorhabdus pacifica]
MCTPDDPARGRGPEGPDRSGAEWRAELVRKWAAGLGATSYIPMSRPAFEECLRELVERIVSALDEPSELEGAGRHVGARLVEMHATGEDSLNRTLDVLREGLGAGSSPEHGDRVLRLVTAVATGYAAADRESTFAQQEAMKKALLRSKLLAERELAFSEARFREVFTSTPIGVAIIDLDGGFVEVNPALEETLGYQVPDLQTKVVYDLFHDEDIVYMRAAYAELAADEGPDRLLERRRMVRADGEVAWTLLAVSVLRGQDGKPRHFVTMIEDISELHLLQERFQYQALHDAMTGLPNRQFFRTRLEAALGSLPKDSALALYHLGLDGFQLINDGLGYEVGDTIIKSVARRLEQLIDGETGMVARFGGTEFAVLLQEKADTPSVSQFAALINEELSEPTYVGEHGIATSASIGVVRSAVSEGDPASMIWSADVALRRAEAAGKRQWALFDPGRAPHERIEAKLAAIMPGALELGEFEICYQPLLSMPDRSVVALRAQLEWEPADHERLEHAECLRLAERSGVTLSLRDWVLRSAWEQLATWHRAGHRVRLVVGLSRNQAQDPDLVAAVRAVLDDEKLDPDWLRLCVPMASLRAESGDARDNVHTLNAMGVQTALHGFGGSPEELRQVRELPLRMVVLAEELVHLVHETTDPKAPEVQAVARLVPLVRECGTGLAVSGVTAPEQAELWQGMGCEIGVGSGLATALPPRDVPAFLADGGS